jgi:EAL domain-containing protein (putative c-di-GMP-specific phosphodiesterase class I)
MQTTRALRHALASFARDGQAALDRAGFADGLAGFVAEAYARAVWLRRAIAERRFRMAFQPIVALHDRAPHHWEALLRPDPDDTSPVSGPQDFVTYAETAGLSEELDWAVLAAVCGAARTARGTRIAANLSGLTLQSALFRDRLLALLDAEPLLAHRLVIEITETAEIEDEAEAVRTVEALRARGLPLCIDDFGAGAAAFRYLRAFRVDYVKIDGLYVANAARSDQDRGIVAGMVDLARTVGAKVVAERIEIEAEAALMQELGVEYGQGWLFGRPGPLPS